MSSDPRDALDASGQLPDAELDIAGVALQFARIDAPASDWRVAEAHLSELAREAVTLARDLPSATARARAGMLAALLGRHGYAGDAETYASPANANLLQVIERRRGLPVALGILWLHCTRAIGWPAHGLNFPGHFLLTVEGAAPLRATRATSPQHVVVDPFSGGRVLEANDLQALLRRVEGPGAELRPGMLQPMPARGVLLRLQNNIRGRRDVQGDVASALACTEDMLRLAPDDVALWREAAVKNEWLDRVAAALRCYTRVVELVPEGDGAVRARAAMEGLRARLN